MKKAFVFALSIILATPHAQAVDIKKVTFSLLKCSWHITKIGGGALCLITSTIPLGTSVIAHALPPIPKFDNSPQDDQIVHDYLAKVADEINEMNQKKVVTDQHIAQADAWYQNNKATLQDWGKSANELKAYIRNRSVIICIGYWAAGSSCIWSGLKGLYHEATSSFKKETNPAHDDAPELIDLSEQESYPL